MEINPVSDIRIRPDSVAGSSAGGNPSFEGVFQAEVAAAGGMRFSVHAQQRLDARNIQLTQQDVARIARSTDDAMAKGAKESLILMDRLALIVGVPNRTVITVMEPHEQANTVFTNIDSVVVVAKDEPSS
ncbi:MAG: TIGR02530 family flagellar biosynthesis protein [Candidatus Hydrogenedentota bacterium]